MKKPVTSEDTHRWWMKSPSQVVFDLRSETSPDEAPFGMLMAYLSDGERLIMKIGAVRMDPVRPLWEVGITESLERDELRQYVPDLYGAAACVCAQLRAVLPKAQLMTHVDLGDAQALRFAERCGFVSAGMPVGGRMSMIYGLRATVSQS